MEDCDVVAGDRMMGIGLCNIVGDSMNSRMRQSVKCHYSQCICGTIENATCVRASVPGGLAEVMDLLRRRLRVKLVSETDSLRMRFLILSMMVTAPLRSSSVMCTRW